MAASLTGLRSVLCLGAHPDDIEIGCGGTLLRLLEADPDLKVHWVVLSGSPDRAAEARGSAASLLGDGAGRISVEVAGFRESFFPYVGEGVKDYIAGVARRVDPDLVFTHTRDDLHQDHRIVAELTWNSFRDHLILEYEIPKWDGDLGRPSVFVPLDRRTCEAKVEHLMATFPSQGGKDWFDPEVFWGLLRVRGMEARSVSGYAEAFHCRKLVLT